MPSSSTVAELWSDVATAGGAAPDASFLANRAADAWLVQSGNIDLFLAPLRNGQPGGCGSHVLRATAGEVICGIDGGESAMGLLARLGPESSVRPISRRSLLATAESLRILESWLDRLADSFLIAPPEDHEILEPWQHICVQQAPKVFVASGGLAWVRVVEGGVRLFGHGALPDSHAAADVGSCFPVPRNAWIIADPGTALEVIDGMAAAETDPSGQGVTEFHNAALSTLVLAYERAESKEQARLRAKAASASAAVESSLRALARPLNGADQASNAAKPLTPVFRACKIAMADLDATVDSSARVLGKPRSDIVAIAAAAGLRVREILLPENWWHEYSGPMVAFRKEDDIPVALVRGGANGYRIHLPANRKSTRVTGANATQLTGVGFLFYRPFPMRPLTFQDLLAFGLNGCGRELGFVGAMGVAAGLLGMAPPLALRALFDHVIPNAERGQVPLLGVFLTLSGICAALFSIAGGFATLRVETRIASALQTATWDRLLSLPVSFFRSYTAGDLANRSTAIDRIRQTLTGPIIASAMVALVSSFQLVVLFVSSVRMGIIAVGLLGVAFAVTTALGVLQVRSQRKITRMQGNISGMLAEFFGGIAKLRVAGAETRAFAYWAERFSARTREWVRSRGFANGLTIFNGAFPAASLAIVYWAGLHLMQTDGATSLTAGEFLAFTAAFQMLLAAVLQVSSAVTAALVVVPEYERLRPLLETAPESGPGKSEAPELTGEIEVSRVTFRYRPDQPPVLRDVSLRVTPGEFVAIVGESGCGKSTLLRILLGFEEPESGAVYYDKQALKGLNLPAVRRQIGVVLQSGRLLAGSILSNIVRTLPLSPDVVMEAARLAGLEDDLNELPMGMHTVLSDGGGGLSGGQRQRVLIARAIVNRPKIVLFDEATSALDNRSQALISERLARLKATRIVIAHRLSTIRNADRILVMQNGQFAQSGTYDQLLHENGPFAELATRQTIG